MKKILIIVLLLISFFALSSCANFSIKTRSEKDGTDDYYEGGDDYYPEIAPSPELMPESDISFKDGWSFPVIGDGSVMIPSGGIRMDTGYFGGRISSSLSGDGNIQPTSGLLTASALFDLDEYEFFQSLLVRGQTEEENGIFYDYQQQFKMPFNLIKVHFTNGPLVKVTLISDKNEEIFETYSDVNGNCYLFTSLEQENWKIRVEYNDSQEEFDVSNGDEITLNNDANFVNYIQIMFVIDTTGSMGDEIDYLKSEIADVINKISNNNQVEVSLAIMVYRDNGDAYVTRYNDFTTDVASQVDFLEKQNASGGGDFEEAVDIALTEASLKNWKGENCTKILVHVADAPAHDKDVNKWFTAVDNLARQGVRIINVASSGIDHKTEFLFRSQCIKTNGCYAFLTNDSGIGGDHLIATTKEKLVVEHLNNLLVRVISGMFTGTYEEAVPYQPKVTDYELELYTNDEILSFYNMNQYVLQHGLFLLDLDKNVLEKTVLKYSTTGNNITSFLIEQTFIVQEQEVKYTAYLSELSDFELKTEIVQDEENKVIINFLNGSSLLGVIELENDQLVEEIISLISENYLLVQRKVSPVIEPTYPIWD